VRVLGVPGKRGDPAVERSHRFEDAELGHLGPML
jgi:hypothetical protein